MIILYGLGTHFWNRCRNYLFSVDEVELIIDNKLSKTEKYKGKILSWDEYVERKEEYGAQTIVISSVTYYDEIEQEILKSGLFAKENIYTIDEWIKCKATASDNAKLLLEMDVEWKYERININRSLQAGFIDDALLGDARVISSREKVLALLPRGGKVAEIGVAFGEFSEKILKIMQPDIFYAIDVFKYKGFWGRNIFEEENISHYDWYARKFKDLIEREKMKLAKGLSWDVMGGYPDNYFDYIYLDAAHDYESVKRDIEQIVRKIRKNGIVQFNDYTFSENFGVIPAVKEMINQTQSRLLYYCLGDAYADVVVEVNK